MLLLHLGGRRHILDLCPLQPGVVSLHSPVEEHLRAAMLSAVVSRPFLPVNLLLLGLSCRAMVSDTVQRRGATLVFRDGPAHPWRAPSLRVSHPTATTKPQVHRFLDRLCLPSVPTILEACSERSWTRKKLGWCLYQFLVSCKPEMAMRRSDGLSTRRGAKKGILGLR